MKKIALALCFFGCLAAAEDLDIDSARVFKKLGEIDKEEYLLIDFTGSSVRTMITNAIEIARASATNNAASRAQAVSNALTQALSQSNQERVEADQAGTNFVVATSNALHGVVLATSNSLAAANTATSNELFIFKGIAITNFQPEVSFSNLTLVGDVVFPNGVRMSGREQLNGSNTVHFMNPGGTAKFYITLPPEPN
jgi:flagellar hook-basal body complex protein FliE